MASTVTAAIARTYPTGSEWRRWDLHVHTPDTALADNFKEGWGPYIASLEACTSVAVVGITDYLTVCNYEHLLSKIDYSRCKIELFLPNIEFRITPQTKKGHAINLHVLVDPIAGHIEEIKTALARLTFDYNKQPYSCTPAELQKLGDAFQQGLTTNKAKLEHGVNQFKIELPAFMDWYDSEKWLKSHSLIAVSAGNDGPSGLRDEGWAALKEEIWRFADIILTGNPANRQFWLAKDTATRDDAERMGGPKPCIHGSDAHELSRVFEPDGKRYCWIKADPTFEGLRQILYEPEERVYLGEYPPILHDQSRVIRHVVIEGPQNVFPKAPIPLNAGLVSIIGIKGSGKSALADLIAYAGGSYDVRDKTSFLSRAAEYVSGTKITLHWADGNPTEELIRGKNPPQSQLVRYLSQSFVEHLGSEDYSGTELTSEIESVIFSHLDPTDTLNASSFTALRQLRTRETTRERVEISGKIRALISEDEQHREIRKTLPEKKARIETLGKEKVSLEKQMPKATSETEAQAQLKVTGLRDQLLKIQTRIGSQKERLLMIEQVEGALGRFRKQVEEFKSEFARSLNGIGIGPGLIHIALSISGESLIADKKAELLTDIRRMEGAQSTEQSEPTIASITAEILKYENALAADQARKQLIQQLQKRISSTVQEIQRIQQEVVDIEAETTARLVSLRAERLAAYGDLFRSWKREQDVLAALYQPVQQKLAAGETEEQRLDFYIKWDVDLEGWLERGNGLFDSRKPHPFGSSAEFRELVIKTMMPGWSSGNAEAIVGGMDKLLTEFKEKKIETFLKSSISHTLLLEWVFDYSHIRLNYGLRYNNTELEKLSPGTKGIVLLILYLGMDSDDRRPLIVDQPEENLDSESVYSLLSKYFRRAKQGRQVIIITHNPNLVVNTDSEQVIVATAQRNASGLPRLSYHSGALEDPITRQRVCSILEGGEKAFSQRERRYGLS